jgi:hypothetical protein
MSLEQIRPEPTLLSELALALVRYIRRRLANGGADQFRQTLLPARRNGRTASATCSLRL